MLPAIERSVDDPDMTKDLAETLSTPTVDVEYRVNHNSTPVHYDRKLLDAHADRIIILERESSSEV